VFGGESEGGGRKEGRGGLRLVVEMGKCFHRILGWNPEAGAQGFIMGPAYAEGKDAPHPNPFGESGRWEEGPPDSSSPSGFGANLRAHVEGRGWLHVGSCLLHQQSGGSRLVFGVQRRTAAEGSPYPASETTFYYSEIWDLGQTTRWQCP
jgi:hypothetical protein